MAEPEIRKIIHVDMDAFYASVEQRDAPELRGKPVAVGGRQRGVVMAASYEARTFGVRSAMPSATAQRLCAELVFVKPRFEVYKEVSRQIREIFLDYTPLVEPLSLDEAYLDVTTNLKGMPLASEIAREIRARIFERTGLTASAGISYNKFLAKLASDHRKPNGQTVIPPEKGPAFVEGLPVAKFHGVGPKTAEKMNRLGIHNGVDLKAQSIEFLEEYFGKAGSYYYAIARGQDDRRVVPNRPRKSVGAGGRLVLLRTYRRRRPHRHGEDQVCRFPDRDPQPHPGRAGVEPRDAGTDQHRAGAQRLPPGKAGAAAGRVAVEHEQRGRAGGADAAIDLGALAR